MQKLLYLAALILLPLSANAENLALKYEANWGGIKVGEMRLYFNEKQSEYNYMALIDSTGLIRNLTKYWSVNVAKGKIAGNKFLPTIFDTKWQRKKQGEQRVIVNYNGEKVTETATPEENRDKRPFVEVKDKKNTLDPVTAGFLARKKIREIMEAKKQLPQSFSLPVFDSRRRFNVNVNIVGYENKKIDDNMQNVLHIKMDRTAIAGFSPKELDAMKKEEPVFDIYLNDKFIPVWVIGKAQLGYATISLVNACFDASDCRL